MINTDFSATSFRVMCTTIGAHNFLGNNIAYPAGGRTGENCLLGTKVMVPLDGPVRADVGLLGSPSFEIPRSVQRDTAFKHLGERDEFRHRLAAKNRHNVVTIALFLLVRWFSFFLLTVILQASEDLTARFGAAALAGALVASFVVNVVYFVLVDRAVTGFHALRPRFCSIYDSLFWRHERFWKVPAMVYVQTFDGTPFKNLVWRALGVRIGRRVFDDGSWMTERSLVEIGDYCTLNAGATLQSHSLEDGTFKSDRISVGMGCTIGTGAFVHYGVRIFDAAELGPDSFLMKGEEMATRSKWRGNPAAPARPPAPLAAQHNGERVRSARERERI
jgi:non-ribosomal peptide synthetase-like protein